MQGVAVFSHRRHVTIGKGISQRRFQGVKTAAVTDLFQTNGPDHGNMIGIVCLNALAEVQEADRFLFFFYRNGMEMREVGRVELGSEMVESDVAFQMVGYNRAFFFGGWPG